VKSLPGSGTRTHECDGSTHRRGVGERRGIDIVGIGAVSERDGEHTGGGVDLHPHAMQGIERRSPANVLVGEAARSVDAKCRAAMPWVKNDAVAADANASIEVARKSIAADIGVDRHVAWLAPGDHQLIDVRSGAG